MIENNIIIKSILKSNSEIRFIEYYSEIDKKLHILNVDKFCDVFGYKKEELFIGNK